MARGDSKNTDQLCFNFSQFLRFPVDEIRIRLMEKQLKHRRDTEIRDLQKKYNQKQAGTK